ncbi:unannotated protein [freshwater metagenome]|uniref:Unannotated protein n=1 Tax=freshwater metagenome TaxID=449393 RepID=A0A6J7FG36_9ZZZZ|nr:hypothetical protein [Actinomycetota bacterium]
MPEVQPNFARDWVEFYDPSNPAELYKCDLTWLTSNWECIYGNGCCGIDEDKPDAGCCSDGAYYSDEDDELRTMKVAQRLTPEMWQYFDEGQPKKGKGAMRISEVGLDGDRKTRKIDDSCIFLNRVGYERLGYTGTFGCVLHHLAQKEEIHFVETKPDVCWQLPIRRSFEQREMGDGTISVNVIGEYERLAWGDGGADFNWYCTSNTEAHVGKEPVYKSNKAELVALMGEAAYGALVEHCENRLEAIALAAATQNKRNLPLFIIHPATVAASK